MAFATIPAWSTTAGTNTEIDGISLAENVMVPSAVNNAFREMMSQVAEFTRRGSDLASAATLDLDSIDTMFLDITGTTTVTAVTLTDGHSRRARATGAFQFTASATLVVNGSTSVNYTTTAGDLLFFEGYGSSTVRVWTLSGGSGSAATTTQQLTGTSTAAFSTPDSVAALWEKGSDEASAGTVAFGEGGFFHITGTTTITDIDFDTAKDGRTVDVIFDGALTLTHNSTTLKLPGGADIVTAAGDRARFVQDSSDNIVCLFYQRAAGAPGGDILAGTAVATTSGTAHDFTGIPAWAKKITVLLSGVSLNADTYLLIQLGTSGGLTTSGYVSGTQVNAGTNSTSTAGFISYAENTSAYTMAYVLVLANPSTNRWVGSAPFVSVAGTQDGCSSGYVALASALTQLRLRSVNGTATFDAGEANIIIE